MATHGTEKRQELIQLRILPSLKEQAKERAAEEGRSLSNYIEYLIQKDIAEHAKQN